MAKSSKFKSDDLRKKSNGDDFVRGNNYLLLIGITDYKDKPLNNCIRDAKAIRDLLHKKYTFDKNDNDGNKLTIELWNNDATKEKIAGELEQISNQISPNDNLVIYFSGHGSINPHTRKFSWTTIESQGTKTLGIKQVDLKEYLDPIICRHIFLISDSCYSGSMFDTTTKSGNSEAASALEKTPSRWGLSSGRDTELVLDGPKGKHSPFAQSLLEILDENKPFLVSELGRLVADKVSLEKEVGQRPIFDRLSVEGHKGGQMVFYPRDWKVGDNQHVVSKGSADILAHLPVRASIGFPSIPFKSLSWFKEEDARVFYGRKSEIKDLYNLLDDKLQSRTRLVLLYGQSGVGKSSLLSAGLIPRLPDDAWIVVYKRRGQDGTATDILEAFKSLLIENKGDKRRAVLILDQLEEIFTNPSGEKEKLLFAKYLEGILMEFPAAKIILSFREEYLGRITDLLQRSPDSYSLKGINYLAKEGLREAIVGVAEEHSNRYRNIKFHDTDLPVIMANDLSGTDQRSHSLLLQSILWQMWHQVPIDDDVIFTDDIYRKCKRDSIIDLIDNSLNEVGVIAPQFVNSGLAIDLLGFLISDEGTSAIRTEADIFEAYEHIDSTDINKLLGLLGDKYLIHSFADETKYRLQHDILAPAIQKRLFESDSPGQKASRFIKNALKSKTPLPKESVLVIRDGLNGMQFPGIEANHLIREAWKSYIKSIAKDYVQNNQVIETLDLVRYYVDKTNADTKIWDMSISLEGNYNLIKRNYSHGTVTYADYRKVVGAQKREILQFINGIDAPFRQAELHNILGFILVGNLESAMDKAVVFFEKEGNVSWLDPMKASKSDIQEVMSDFAKGRIAYQEEATEFMQVLNNLIDTIVLCLSDSNIARGVDLTEIIVNYHKNNADYLDLDKYKERLTTTIIKYLIQIACITFYLKRKHNSMLINWEEYTIAEGNLKKANKLLEEFYLNENSQKQNTGTIKDGIIQIINNKVPDFLSTFRSCSTKNVKNAKKIGELLGKNKKAEKDLINLMIESNILLVPYETYRRHLNKGIFELLDLIQNIPEYMTALTSGNEVEFDFDIFWKSLVTDIDENQNLDISTKHAFLSIGKVDDWIVIIIRLSMINDLLTRKSENSILRKDYEIEMNQSLESIKNIFTPDTEVVGVKLSAAEEVTINKMIKAVHQQASFKLIKSHVSEMISSNDIHTCITYLEKIGRNTIEEDIPEIYMISGRFNNLMKAQNKNIIKWDEFSTQNAQLVSALLEIGDRASTQKYILGKVVIAYHDNDAIHMLDLKSRLEQEHIHVIADLSDIGTGANENNLLIAALKPNTYLISLGSEQQLFKYSTLNRDWSADKGDAWIHININSNINVDDIIEKTKIMFITKKEQLTNAITI